MLKEDHKSVANLPQEVKQYAYPKQSYLDRETLDDTIMGVDRQIGQDVGQMKRRPSRTKY